MAAISKQGTNPEFFKKLLGTGGYIPFKPKPIQPEVKSPEKPVKQEESL